VKSERDPGTPPASEVTPARLNRIRTGAYYYTDKSRRRNVVISAADFELLVGCMRRVVATGK